MRKLLLLGTLEQVQKTQKLRENDLSPSKQIARASFCFG